jgi:hypothetical protein
MDGAPDWDEAGTGVGSATHYASACWPDQTDSNRIKTMRPKYIVAGSFVIAAVILTVVSSNSYRSTDECRNWSARSITSLFIPCAAKAEVDDPFNIGAAPIEQKDIQTNRK